MTAMKEVVELFATLLDQRLKARVFTTEDSIRYTYFHALLSSRFCQHTDIVLEHPHPTLERQMIDILIAARSTSPSIAIEFKYDRAIPSDQNLNMTNRAGAVFSDLFKLAHIPSETAQLKYFFYVTDGHMANYFQNERNGYRSFFELQSEMLFLIGAEWAGTRPKSFQDRLQCTPVACTVSGLISRKLWNEHYLRAYELKVQHASATGVG